MNGPSEADGTPPTLTDVREGRSWGAVFAQGIPFALILLLAVELRLLFRTGLADIDALVYAHLARNFSDGIFRLSYDGLPFSAVARVGLYGPVAALYALFGANDVTTMVWPFACSLLGIICAYGLGRRLAGEAAGLLAAFLWAVLPTGVAAATALMGDGPIAGLSIGVVFFLLLAESTRGFKRAAALAASLACFVIGIANKPVILLLLAFLVVYAVWKRPKNPLMWLGLVAAIATGLAGYHYYYASHVTGPVSVGVLPSKLPTMQVLAGTATDWWSQVVMGTPEFSWIAPLWIVAAAALVALRRREAYAPLLWFASMFLYLELGSRSLSFYQPITIAYLGTGTGRHFLLLAAPAMIASGIYLAQGLRPAAGRWLILFAATATGAVAWTGTRHATNLDWGITGETMLPFEIKSALAIGATIFGAIASPVVTSGAPAKWKALAVALLSCAIGVASLNLSYRAATVYRATWLMTMPEAVQFLEQNPSLPILVQNEVFGQRLDYSSHFRFGFNSVLRNAGVHARISLAPQDPKIIHDAYILIDEYYLRASHAALWGDGPAYFRSPPANFAEVARFGDRDGYRVKVYQVSEALAAKQLDAARSAVYGSRNSRTLRQLLTAATGAREYCEAAAAWQALRLGDAQSLKGFDPLPLIKECAARQPNVRGPNLFQNGDFAQGLQGWSQHPDSDASVSVGGNRSGDHAWHVKWRGGNWSVIYQEQVLQPDTVYVYEADVKTTAPVVSLYWQTDIGRFFELTNTYPDWTHLLYVFITPHWNGQPMRTGFNPVLMKGPGDVWVKGLSISEFRAPNVQ